MRRVLAWWLAALALTLAVPAAVAQGQDQVNSLALRLYEELSVVDASKNVFFSPISIASAFSWLHLGARGTTRKELEAAFGFGVGGVADSLRGGRLVALGGTPEGGIDFLLANRLFLKGGLELLESFASGVRSAESTGLEEVDFGGDPAGSRKLINDFVSRATMGHIVDIMPPMSVTPDTVLVVANAVFFQAAWKFPFFERETQRLPFVGFRGGDSTVQTMTQMMTQKETSLKIGEAAGAQILELPYEGDMASMLIVLPKDDSPAAFSRLEAGLKGMSIAELKSNMSFKDVDVYLPKFEVEDSADLKAILPKLGVKNLFLPSADLSGIFSTTTGPLSVSSALHKAKILVDEQGTVAAAATTASVVPTSFTISMPEVFKADHPFIYFVVDNGSGTILFMGNIRGLST